MSIYDDPGKNGMDLEKLAILKEAVMDNGTEAWKDPVLLMKDIESKMDQFFSSRRDEIEKELAAKIENEKREAEKRKEDVGREFSLIKTALIDHKNVIAGLQASRDDIYDRMRGHFNRAVEHRNAAGLAMGQAAEELGMLGELKQELSRISGEADKETASIKASLEKMGVSLDLPGLVVIEDPVPDFEREMLRIRNIREILASGTPETSVRPAEAGTEQPAAAPGIVKGDPFSAEQPQAAPEPERQAEEDPAGLLEALHQFERVESVGNGTSLTFYEGPRSRVIDVISLIQAMDKVTEEATELHTQLAKTSSIKDLFLTKQEILNKQEILRKAFYMSVKYCDKEGGALPGFISNVFSVDIMKNALERLTLGNWSDLNDFQVFNAEAAGIFDELRARLAAYPAYLRSIIEQI